MWDLPLFEESGEERIVWVLWECVFAGAVQRAESGRSSKDAIPVKDGYYLYPTPQVPLRIKIVWPTMSVSMVRKLAEIHALYMSNQQKIDAVLGSEGLYSLREKSVTSVREKLHEIVKGESDKGEEKEDENDKGEEDEEDAEEEEDDQGEENDLDALRAQIEELQAENDRLRKRKRHYKSLYRQARESAEN